MNIPEKKRAKPDTPWAGGFSSTVFLIFLALGILFSSVVAYISSVQQRIISREMTTDQAEELALMGSAAIESLRTQLSDNPEAMLSSLGESMQSAVVNSLPQADAGEPPRKIAVYLTDLSGRLNINLVSPEFISLPAFNDYFVSSSTRTKLLELRKEKGLFTSRSEFLDFLSEDRGQNTIDLYSLIQLDVSDPEQAGIMMSLRTGDPTIGADIQSRMETRKDSGQLWTDDELAELIAGEGSVMDPLLTITGQIDINTCDPNILEAVLGLEYGGKIIPKFQAAIDDILTLRERQHIDDDLLKDLLQLDEVLKDNPHAALVLRYLGTQSWFWRIRIEYNTAEAEYVVAKLPPTDESPQEISLQLIRQRVYPAGKLAETRE